MNKIYRTIWNAASGRWIAVQENARARGAKGGSGARSRSRLACGALAVAAAWGGGVRAGTVLDTDGATVIAADICTGTTIGGSGLNYLAMGCNASASDTDSIAIGTSSVANGASALALGDHTYAIANGATALGGGATASGVQSVALGGDKVDAHQDAAAKATGERAVAVGAATRAMGNNSVALGSTVTAAADNAVAIGSGAAVSGAGSVALGVKASGLGANAAAIGAGSAASGDASTAIGNLAVANGQNAIALGTSASASADNAVAMGQGAKGTSNRSIAIGQIAIAQGTNSIALGYKATTSVGGTADGNIALGENALINNTGSGAIAIGRNAYVEATLGNGQATGASTLVVGDGAYAYGNNVTVIGASATATHTGNVVLGSSAVSSGISGASAFGTSATASGAGGSAIGAQALASASNATAIGYGATATTVNSVALGYGATTAAAVKTPNGVIGGQTFTYAGATPTGVVSVGAATAERQVTNVAAGQVNASSTDAVNGSQLYATNTQVTVNTSAVTTLQGEIADAVMYDSTAHDRVTLGGVGSNVKLTNVAAATLTGTSTDAVNGSQLYATNNNVTAISNTVNKITSGGGIMYFHTNSMLADSAANGPNSTAIGPGAVTTYTDDIAIGNGASASRPSFSGQGANVALGASATAQGYRSVAIGYGARTNTGSLYTSASDIAIGQTAFSEGYNSVALGNNANAGTAGTDGNNVAVGSNTYAKASGAVAFGGSATAAASSATALGAAANAGASGATAVGKASTASVSNAVAIGYGANASVADSVALGHGATTEAAVNTPNGVIGGQTFTYAGATPTGVVSVGSSGHERQVTNVAAGRVTAASTDAVNGSQLYATNTQVTTNTGAISTLQALTADAVMYDSTAHDSVTLGGAGTSTPVALHNVAAGAVSDASNDAVNGSQLYKLASSTASGLGGGSTVSSDGSITTPTYSVGGATFHNAGEAFTNIDGRTTANTDALSTLQGQTADAVMYDSSSHDSVRLGGADSSTPVALHNVAAGTVSNSSNDAVNGSQLFKLASSTASGLGGGSTVSSDGSITTPTYTIGGATFHNAGEAFTNIDGRTTANTDALSTLQGQTADAVMYDSSSHDSVTLGGAGTSTPVALHNVAAGTVSNSSNDAVNGSQLYKLASSTASGLGGGSTVNSDGSITTPTYSVGGATFHNAGEAFTNIDGRTTANADAISNLQGQTADAVMYDSTAHDSVTLGGTSATAPIALHNVANGAVDASSFDAINGSQLFGVSSALVNALGGGASVSADGSITLPTYRIGNTTFHNVGGALTNLDGRVTDLSDAVSSGTIGLVQQDATTHAITVGKDVPGISVDFAGTNGVRLLTGVAAGNVDASSVDAVNGSQLFAIGNATANALGGGATMNANGTMSGPNYAIGGNTYNNVGGALTDLDGRVAQNAQDISDIKGDVANAVAYDSSAHDSVTLGDGGTPVSLHNVAAGTADTDAVNLGQMNDAIASVQQAADAAVNPFVAAQGNRDTEGAIASGTHATAAGANAVASGANAVALGANTQATGANSVALGADSVADRDNAVSVGSAGNERQITNVAPGTAGTDAANMNQLNAMAAQGQGYVDQRISGVQNQISDVRRDAFGAAAAAMAVAGLPQPTEPGRTMVAAAGSRIGGQTGMALGVSYVTRNNRWVAKASASSSSQGNTGVTLGAGYQW
ncbi:YadA-like family protein [Paraburkholderia tropica]|uniref:YadA-like family protein n=3 Tax=Paraburkholderia tropica TaxID=92647 RepID=UPI002ABDAB8B|nr:YadA-like family protein [Paraburkholderia tropica]